VEGAAETVAFCAREASAAPGGEGIKAIKDDAARVHGGQDASECLSGQPTQGRGGRPRAVPSCALLALKGDDP
jgi:hypothetical protein